MSDLISRSALIRRFAYYHAHSYGKAEYAYGVAAEEVLNAPAVDAVPVVHGKWLATSVDPADPYFRCSVCHYGIDEIYNGGEEPFNYCPNCGAKMDGGTEC